MTASFSGDAVTLALTPKPPLTTNIDSTLHASPLPVWLISLKPSKLQAGVHTAYNTVLDTIAPNKCLESPFDDKPCVVVLEGQPNSTHKYRQTLCYVVNTQLAKGNHVVFQVYNKHDHLHNFVQWQQFAKVSESSNIFTSSTCSSYVALEELLKQLPVANYTKKQLVPGPLQVHYELGDHADNAIQEVSATRKKVHPIESHFDDCGDDTSPLILPELSAYEYCFECLEPSPDETVPDFVERMLDLEDLHDVSFFCSHLWGPDVHPPSTHTPESLAVFLAHPSRKRGIDFMEIFGGKEGVTTVGIRRQLKTGINFDVVASYDLRRDDHVAMLWSYIKQYAPLCIVMGPPCTAFSSWSSYNKVHAVLAWEASLAEGLPLARLAAAVASYQIENNRFFLAENPWSSKLWELPEWQRILSHDSVVFSKADQCMYGLRDMDSELNKKPTCFVANSKFLLEFLHKQCDGSHHHGQLAGSL